VDVPDDVEPPKMRAVVDEAARPSLTRDHGGGGRHATIDRCREGHVADRGCRGEVDRPARVVDDEVSATGRHAGVERRWCAVYWVRPHIDDARVGPTIDVVGRVYRKRIARRGGATHHCRARGVRVAEIVDTRERLVDRTTREDLEAADGRARTYRNLRRE